jgi:hypothetical protein
MITVGHSLGGAIVLSAVKRKLSGNADDVVHPDDRNVRITRSEQSRVPALSTGKKALRASLATLFS